MLQQLFYINYFNRFCFNKIKKNEEDDKTIQIEMFIFNLEIVAISAVLEIFLKANKALKM